MLTTNNYIFIERDIKHARLKVSENGTVHVIVPHSFTQHDVSTLLKKKERWIEKNLVFFRQKSKINLQRNQLLLYGNRYAYFYDSTFEQKVIVDHKHKTIRGKRDLLNNTVQEKWYKTIARKYLVNRANELGNNLRFSFNKIFIRSQRKKWGNCSTDKNISLNWRLIKAPLFVIDYLIVHELVHTEIMNHSLRFWTMLRSFYPDYKNAVKWLDIYGNSL